MSAEGGCEGRMEMAVLSEVWSLVRLGAAGSLDDDFAWCNQAQAPTMIIPLRDQEKQQ